MERIFWGDKSDSKQKFLNTSKVAPSFKGLTIETGDDGRKHHVFYTPALSSKGDVKLEIVPLVMDKNGNYQATGKPVGISPAKQNGVLKLWEPHSQDEKSLLNITDPSIKLAYRFLVNGQPLLDEVRREKINGTEFNLAWDPERPDLKKPRTIYHLMPDMVGISLDEKGNPKPDRRNHFNNFGGTINDIAGRVDYISDMGATRILSTPVFNNGPKNSNGYWTKNPYQVDPVRGNLKDFKDLQVKLFKKGMGFIADGAFVNESWEGIHVKDIIKYGENSPFTNWFFITDKEKSLNPALLPAKVPAKLSPSLPPAVLAVLKQSSMSDEERAIREENLKHLGIKIINGDYQLKYPESGNGDPVVEKNPQGKNSKLPTKIQIFDRRFVPIKGKQNDSEKLIDKYDINSFNEPDQVKRFNDSVQLASFEIKASADQKILGNKLGKAVSPYELATSSEWGNFHLIHPDDITKGSNISMWDGQNDIAKLRFFVTKTERDELKNDPAKLKALEKASAQVQDNVVQVGEHWTSEVEKTLSEHTAKELSKKLATKGYAESLSTEQKAKLIKAGIDELAGTELPADSKDITEKQIKNVLTSNYDKKAGGYTGSYNLPVATLPSNITEGIMSYPLEAIDFPDEVCSLLGSPNIKKLASKPGLINVSRYDLMSKPEYAQTSSIYKKMDKDVYGKMTPIVAEIINSSDVLKSKMKVDDKGNLTTQQGQEIFRIISGDVAKYMVVKALADTSPTAESLKAGKGLEYNSEELAKNSFTKKLYGQDSSHDVATEQLVDSISEGITKRIDAKSKNELKGYLETRVEGLDGDSLKVSKLILNKTESGLEWRIDAARDVADMTKIINEYQNSDHDPKPKRTKNTFADSWDNVIDFWGKFITGVKTQNPKYFAIGESSNMHKAYPEDLEKGNYPTLGTVERKFAEQTKFTTTTNYPYLFSSLPNIVHQALDPEYIEDGGQINLFDFMKGKLLNGWCRGESGECTGFLKSAPVDAVLYSHVGLTNHDSFRTLHGLSMDSAEFTVFPGKTNGVEATPDKLERWGADTEIGKKLRITVIDKKETYKGIRPIFDKAFIDEKNPWYKNKSEDDKWNFVFENWNAGWIENDNDGHRVEKAGLLDKYKTERANVKARTENANNVKKLYSANIVMADTILQSYQAADPHAAGISEKADGIVQKAIDNLATGTIKGKFMGNEMLQHFGRRAVNHNWQDIVEEAKFVNANAPAEKKITNDDIKKLGQLGDKVYEKFVAPGMKKELALEYYKAVLPGSPTLYNGQDTAETGFESNGKNVFLYNRNRVHYEWLSKPYIKTFNDQLKGIIGLRKRAELSPLVNGQTVMLKPMKDADGKDETRLFALYRYNKDRDVIAIFNNDGFSSKRADCDVKPHTIPSIDTNRGINDPEKKNDDKDQFGIEGGIKTGTRYIDAFDKDKKPEYVVDNEGKLRKEGKDGQLHDIEVNGPALILYRAKKFSEA